MLLSKYTTLSDKLMFRTNNCMFQPLRKVTGPLSGGKRKVFFSHFKTLRLAVPRNWVLTWATELRDVINEALFLEYICLVLKCKTYSTQQPNPH
jgi:hypothetical protein